MPRFFDIEYDAINVESYTDMHGDTWIIANSEINTATDYYNMIYTAAALAIDAPNIIISFMSDRNDYSHKQFEWGKSRHYWLELSDIILDITMRDRRQWAAINPAICAYI